MIRLPLCLFLLLSISGYAQQKERSWEQVTKQYKLPKWYTEARFGIWVHWGAQTQPDSGGGWYARHMYMQDVGKETWGKNAYAYQVHHYGHPSDKGFKEVIHDWKAEKLNTDELVRYFKSIGAKYFVALANHHDHFDNFASTYHAWNSVNVGPKKDLIGLFRNSAKKYGVPFGVSSHDDRFLSWWLPAFGADKTGPKKGIPYDGRQVKADGIGKWWAGLDPAELYGLPPEKRTPEYLQRVKQNYVQRMEELVSKYNVDMLWFDGYGFPYGDYGKQVCDYFLNDNYQKHGNFTAVIAGKFQGKEPAIVEDIERGGASEILSYPWQGTLTFGSWFYKKDRQVRHDARTVIETLIDINSKNGNLLLNVELLPDGRIPPPDKLILDTIGRWINRNAEAIYASTAWKIYGDNMGKGGKNKNLSETDLDAQKQEKGNDFNERTIASTAYPHDEIRYTTKGNSLYVFVLNPAKGAIKIPSLGFRSKYHPGKIVSLKLLGSSEMAHFKQNDDYLSFTIPEKAVGGYALVFRIKLNNRDL